MIIMIIIVTDANTIIITLIIFVARSGPHSRPVLLFHPLIIQCLVASKLQLPKTRSNYLELAKRQHVDGFSSAWIKSQNASKASVQVTLLQTEISTWSLLDLT